MANKWPDPHTDKFEREYIIQYARMLAYKEIFELIEGAEQKAVDTAKQLDKTDKNYGL